MAEITDVKSVYKVLAMYIEQAQKVGNYIKGYLDGEQKLEAFLKEYSDSSHTKFIIRSSCKKSKEYSSKGKGNSASCTRYGREDRIYWEFNNRNLVVPFTGTPFVTNSSQVKHCQHGAQYYKLKAEKLQVQTNDCVWNTPSGESFAGRCTQQTESKRRRVKASKKCNCPAYMYIREVILFPEYSLSSEVYNASKHIVRKEKANLINQLKQAMPEGNIKTIHRYFLNIPLPEAHSDHPIDANAPLIRVMDPMVRTKIDELLTIGYYEIRHIQLIIHDFVREMLMKSGLPYEGSDAYPTIQEINDYIYLSTLTGPAVAAVPTKEDISSSNFINMRLSVQEEMKQSIKELSELINSCTDEETLNKAEKQIKRVIDKVKNANPATIQRSQRKRPLSFLDNTSKKACVEPAESSLPASNACTNQESLGYPSQPKLITDCSNLPTDIMLTNSHNVCTAMTPSDAHHAQAEQTILTTFSRLMESDHDIMPSLVDHVVSHDTSLHQGGLVPSDLAPLTHFHDV